MWTFKSSLLMFFLFKRNKSTYSCMCMVEQEVLLRCVCPSRSSCISDPYDLFLPQLLLPPFFLIPRAFLTQVSLSVTLICSLVKSLVSRMTALEDRWLQVICLHTWKLDLNILDYHYSTKISLRHDSPPSYCLLKPAFMKGKKKKINLWWKSQGVTFPRDVYTLPWEMSRRCMSYIDESPLRIGEVGTYFF